MGAGGPADVWLAGTPVSLLWVSRPVSFGKKRGGLLAGAGGLQRLAVQCASPPWRRPGRKLVTGAMDPSGTGSVSCDRA